MSPYNNAIPDHRHSVADTAAWLSVVTVTYFLVLAIIAGPHFLGHKLKVGDIAEQDLISLRRTLIVDNEKTQAAKDESKQSVLPVLVASAKKSADIYNRVLEGLNQVEQVQKLGLVPHTKGGEVVPPGRWNKNVLLIAAMLPPNDLKSWRDESLDALKRLLNSVGFQPYVNQKQWESQIYEYLPDRFAAPLRSHTAKLMGGFIEANVVVDQEATEEKMRAAVDATAPVMKEIDRGEIVVARGDIISPESLQALQAVGLTHVSDFNLGIGIAVALMAAFGLFGVFLHTFEPHIFYSPSSLCLISTVGILTLGTALFVGSQAPQFAAFIPFIPLPAAGIVLSIIFGRRVAVIVVALLIIFLQVSNILPPVYLFALGAGGAVSLVASIKKRRDFITTGVVVGFLQSVGYLATALFGFNTDLSVNLGRELPLQFMGGVFSSVIAIGTLPFLESIFGILTPFRLSELAEPDQPLIRQLEENAPGTYQHSLAVANLAEGGARAIGADVNLVRTGAMYHDIGKMVTPRYFIENQLGDKNPHDFIAPEESRARVLAHVTNGLVLAQKYGLPKAVQAFIPEHQGTTVMAFFYHKACMRDGADKVDQKDYRYPGPKPQTRESAIVMLADVSEAVTHSMQNPTQEEVESAMSNVFKARWDDGQFNESGLTISELERVKKGFVRVWRTLHHDRLKYPSTTTGRMPVPPSDAAMASARADNAAASAANNPDLEQQAEPGQQADPADDCCGPQISSP